MDYSARLLSLSDVNIWVVAFLIILLVISGFFSMSETIFSSVNQIRLKTFIEEGKKGAKKAFWISDNFDLTISTILVGNNLANIALATLSVSVFSQIFNDNELVVNIFNTVVMTTLILIFGEIIPKSIGKNRSDSLSLSMSPVMYFIINTLRPITWIFIKIKESIVKSNNENLISVTEDELETIIDTMEEEGSIDEDEAEMLQSVLDLSEKKVYEIMTPRVDMIGVFIDDEIETIKKVFFEYQFSRIPVFEETRDNVVGILTERDFFTKLIKGQKVYMKKLMREPLFVSKSMRVDTLIETLQRENSHLAVVSGEFGGTSGIVTMEDALEELVGEIYDEHDEIEDEFIQPIKDYKWGINADIDLEDLFEDLKLGNPPVTQYSTLSSWLYEQFEDIPEEDEYYSFVQEVINYDHEEEETDKFLLKFVVKDIKERRIKYVVLTKEALHEEE
ncbi:hemolysin family protein [Candidatus Izimaplasma bacterium ZiA1]|uniref:hemolysin family protein n=1 Tax=Candidatus Izimoplasma sp. ZiA1 TaxID=2024899 RepID=UPI0011778DE8